MLSIKIIAIIGLIGLGYGAAEFTTLLNKQESLVARRFKFPVVKNYFPKDRLYLPYSICNLNTKSDYVQCEIIRQSLNSTSNGSSCEIKVKRYILDTWVLHDFDDNKVIVYWYDRNDNLPNYYLRFTIVQFPDCTEAEAKIKFDLEAWRNINFVRSVGAIFPTGDRFKVAFDNSGLFGNTIDEQTFDLKGNVIQPATTWFKPLGKQSIAIIDNYKNDNYIMTEHDIILNRFRFSMLNESGLKVLNISIFEDYEKFHVGHSAFHDTLRLCGVIEPSSQVDCYTFDRNGKSIGNNTFQLNHEPIIVLAHNLVDGGFFLLTVTSEKRFYINKFSADGKHIVTMELPGYECKPRDLEFFPMLYENEKNQYCVVRICYEDYRQFNIVNKCFNDKDVK